MEGSDSSALGLGIVNMFLALILLGVVIFLVVSYVQMKEKLASIIKQSSTPSSNKTETSKDTKGTTTTTTSTKTDGTTSTSKTTSTNETKNEKKNA